MWAEDSWRDYELLDTSDGEKLERWGKYILVRPDPQIIWKGIKRHPLWKRADAVYSRSRSGGGSWSESKLPAEWKIGFPIEENRNIEFIIKPTGFKHTGLFPEQAANWKWFYELIKNSGRKIKVLNLFAYTGGATVAAAAAGAEVCHVDASKGMVAQAKQNMALNGMAAFISAMILAMVAPPSIAAFSCSPVSSPQGVVTMVALGLCSLSIWTAVSSFF